MPFGEEVPEKEIDVNEDEAQVLRNKIQDIKSNPMNTVVARYRAALKAMALIDEAFNQVFQELDNTRVMKILLAHFQNIVNAKKTKEDLDSLKQSPDFYFVHDLCRKAECTCLSDSQPNNYGAFRKSLLQFNFSGLIANNVLRKTKTQMIDHARAPASADTLSMTGSASSVAFLPVVSVPIPSPPESPSSETISSKEDFGEEKD